ncbi:MAG: Purine-binding protein [Chloroflexi bacterium]|nr:Purine-binding protein [Chloroflexota bacterium]
MKTKRILWVILALLLVSSMLFAACKPKPTEEVEEVTEEEEMEEEEAAGTLYERAMAGEFDGKVVTMTGPFTDEDAVKFDNSVAAFEEATGIDIQYEGSKEFEATISVRVEAGDPPDIVDFPQPGLLKTFVAGGHVVDVSTFLPQSSFDNYKDSWWDMAEMAGPDGTITAGVWHRYNAKSQVWYPKEEFDAAGYEIPETWDEMVALSDLIVADGDKPWCVGIESGAATGWPATDWMEEVMLRTTSLENYDKWTTGELPFSSPEVKHALEVLDELWADEYVYGGSEAIVTTFFGDAPTPMFEDPPKCWLHKQGNFITTFFPEGVEAGTDYDFFYLPGIDEEYGKPYLVAGDIMAMFNDRPEVRAVMEFFTKGEAVKEWLAAGGALSPHKDSELSWYGDDIERGVAELVKAADSVRFDGSDLMPGEVGAGSFWTGMTDYFSGTADADTVLAEIDASWPAAGEEPAEEEEMEEEEGLTLAIEHFSIIEGTTWSGAHHRGGQRLAEKYPDLDYVYREEVMPDVSVPYAEEMISEGADIVVGNAEFMGMPLAEIAEKYPDVNFISIIASDPTTKDNFLRVFPRQYQALYLEGLVAAALTETGNIGVVSAFPSVQVIRRTAGFYLGVQDGAELLDKDITVYVKYSGDWYLPQEERDIAATLVDQYEVDVITQQTDSGSPLDVAIEKEIWFVGKDMDIVGFYGWGDANSVAISFDTRWEVLYNEIIKDMMAGEQPDKVLYLGMDSSMTLADGTEIATVDIMNDGKVGVEAISPVALESVPQEIVDLVEQRRAEMMAGEWDPFTARAFVSNGTGLDLEGLAVPEAGTEVKAAGEEPTAEWLLFSFNFDLEGMELLE